MCLNVEKQVSRYLLKYGNTEEDSLIAYCAAKLNCPIETVKEAVEGMVAQREVHRIVHDELNPPKTYVSLMKQLHPYVMRSLVELFHSKAIENDAANILNGVAQSTTETEDAAESTNSPDNVAKPADQPNTRPTYLAKTTRTLD